MKHFLHTLFASTLALVLMGSPALAHEGHQEDMSDAEMAQMEAANSNMPHDMMMQDEAGSAAPTATPAVVPQSAERLLTEQIANNRVTSAGDFLGRLHPVAAHFPIVLLLMAGFAELLIFFRPALGLGTAVRFMVAGGAIGAVVSAALGWFAAGWRLTDRSDTLFFHRWNGTAVALVSLLAWWIAARGKGRAGLRTVLALLAAGLATQGYLGGEMVFGPNHLGLQ
tara:strand:+ start:18235 stop:18909 length:675 start_codon:yes stop_codon:yes gene_type:complete